MFGGIKVYNRVIYKWPAHYLIITIYITYYVLID